MMMFGSDKAFQTVNFFEAFGMGTLLGVIYSLFMLLRITKKHCTAAVIAEDILFAIVAALLTFIFLLDINYGTIRMYIIGAECLGFISNYLVYGKNIMKILKKLLHTV